MPQQPRTAPAAGPRHGVLVERDVETPMRDGTILRGTVYRPAGDGRFPVLLSRLPYGKDVNINTGYFDPVRAAAHGYVVIMQDVRGRFASGGEFVPNVHEAADGHDTVRWAARLPCSDGRVGMWGRSYHAGTQWRAALTDPPGLLSLVPGVCAGHTTLDGTGLRGGAREFGSRLSWVLGTVGGLDEEGVCAAYDALPLTAGADGPLAEVLDELRWPLDDPRRERHSLIGRYDRVRAASFHIGGWFDVFLNATLAQYEAAATAARHHGGRPPHLMIGPWSHTSFTDRCGQLDFGPHAVYDLNDAHLRWFDATLKGAEERLADTPPVRLFVMGENRWRGYDTYPAPTTRAETWHLHPGGLLDRQAPPSSEPDSYTYAPKDPVPTLGGATLLPSRYPPGPHDQRDVEQRPDVLSWTSTALDRPYTVLGSVHATLYAASSAPDTDFVARLVDVHPDGTAIALTDGIIRASARDSHPVPGTVRPVSPTPIRPDAVYRYVVDLWATATTFLPGHRIRVDITSSSHPRWDRNLNTGATVLDSARSRAAHQLVFHDPQRPSGITLTVASGP
ncbi:CocE/NonD family hydrolase [Streptomyces sp. LZ34]